jgi:acyl-CoA synthetase (AMP-forming)/AMP-acid ligase II
MLITGGFNVYPRDAEEVLYARPAVPEAALVKIPDPHRGEVRVAFAVLRPGARDTADEYWPTAGSTWPPQSLGGRGVPRDATVVADGEGSPPVLAEEGKLRAWSRPPCGLRRQARRAAAT